MTKEDLMFTVGNNLKTYRLLRNMTQEELSELVGVSTSFCANIERGKKGVSIFILRDFADALGITANDLLYDVNTDQRIDNIPVFVKNCRIFCKKFPQGTTSGGGGQYLRAKSPASFRKKSGAPHTGAGRHAGA